MRRQGQRGSPQGQEKQESRREGCHRNAVAQVVDHEGDVVVQAVLPLLDRQTDTLGDRGMGHREGRAGPLAMTALWVLTWRAEVAPGVLTAPGSHTGPSSWPGVAAGRPPTGSVGADLYIVSSGIRQRCR